jgi:hypothetical protein
MSPKVFSVLAFAVLLAALVYLLATQYPEYAEYARTTRRVLPGVF